MLDPRREDAEADRDERPGDDDEPEVVAVQRPSRPIGPTGGEVAAGAAAVLTASPRRRKQGVRPSTSDAGQAPTSAKSHWLTATKAARSRNQGSP